MKHAKSAAARGPAPAGPTQAVPPRRRGPYWIGAGVVLMALGGAILMLPHFRSPEAEAAMLAAPAPVDGNRAYTYLKQICAMGPRIAGTEANTRQRQMVKAHFEKLGAKITEQPFSGEDPKTHAKVSMVNLVASWHPERTARVVIGAHYDTRPFPDEDPDPARRKLPFLGANDGASGVALLMEIAHHLHEDKLNTPWGVDLVLFDGEEIVYGSGPNGQVGEYFLGSKEFARRYAVGVDENRIRYRYNAGFVLDMVGDKDLAIDQEENSVALAPGLVRDLWNVARQIRVSQFRNRVGTSVLDDHLPLNNAGIPAIDIIDFNYPYWHTSQDVPENCSAASLEAVGKVITAWLAQPRRRR